MRAGERLAREIQSSTTGFRYDTALIKEDPSRLLAEYLGHPGKVSGPRLVWDCPRCGKPKLSLFRTKGVVGCLNGGCDVEGETDVIGVIASLEGLSTRGEDFKRVCALCYRLLSPPDLTAPAQPSSTTEPEHAEAVPDPAAAETEIIADGPGTQEPELDVAGAAERPADGDDSTAAGGEGDAADGSAGEQDAGFDAYDRWYAVLEGHPGAAELAVPPEPYKPHDIACPVPGAFVADEAEFQWSALAGLAAALLFWYYVGASDGWLAVGVRFLPSLPDPPPVLYGIPFALLFGATVGILWLLRTRSRRLAARRHLLGEERR